MYLDQPYGTVKGATDRLWAALGNSSEGIVNRMNTDPEFPGLVAHVLRSLLFKRTPSVIRASKIMGKNFLGLEDAVKHLNINPLQWSKNLDEVPFAAEVLEECKDSHVLVAYASLNRHGVGEAGWKLVSKTPLPMSLNKTWEVQRALLGSDEEVPSSAIMSYAIMGYYRKTGERLFKKEEGRCSDFEGRDGGGRRMAIGNFFNSLYLPTYHDDEFHYRLGLCVARKDPTELPF